jgi:hypothetical protein
MSASGSPKLRCGGLSKLKRHTAERTAYLHSIGSDPAVIAHQRLKTGQM